MITVHHLENSRSQRVLWLLEELGTPYTVKRYARHPETMLAPPELKAVHPLGKSPVISDDGTVVAESGAIVEYLCEMPGQGHGQSQEKPKSSVCRSPFWFYYCETV
jgi:glutathione S-transferase